MPASDAQQPLRLAAQCGQSDFTLMPAEVRSCPRQAAAHDPFPNRRMTTRQQLYDASQETVIQECYHATHVDYRTRRLAL